MTTYARILSAPAISIDSSVTATPFPPVSTEDDDSVFCYRDTASSRAGIAAVTRKLELGKIGIVGLGGTGAYVLDLVAKTPVKEIHLFDGDTFSQHNAFRAPGAASIDELRQRPQKVAYLKAKYSMMHRHIIEHDVFIDVSTASLLEGMDFVFLCLDKGEPKREIVAKLEAIDVPFIDVGMGVNLVDGSLLGVVRATTSTPVARAHVHRRNRIPFSDNSDNNEYSKNIQIADLNALNAAFAVIRWKKLLGFYHDLERELFSTYTIDGNKLINEDHDEASDGVAA